ncbi:hypothetical protein L7F22_008815 [Adiantum nelumboides]|nr:hypothetical protein [Adiantum nelumboides]
MAACTQISNGHHHRQLANMRHGYGFSEAADLHLPHLPQNHSNNEDAMKLQRHDVHVDEIDDYRRLPHVEHATPHENHACILAIARAVPPYKVIQQNYADFYFNVTNCQHMTRLKLKMQRICERSKVETRHSIMTEEFLRQYPELYTPGTPSLELRHRLLAEEVPRLAAQAAEEALREWGRPAHHITHLVVVTLSGVAIPGADVRLVQLLGLRPCVRRVMLYMLGCYAGVTALRVAKDLAENNPGSRVLVCCSELSATTFRAPHEFSPYNLVSAALFGDGAAALIIGAQPQLAPPLNITHSPAANTGSSEAAKVGRCLNGKPTISDSPHTTPNMLSCLGNFNGFTREHSTVPMYLDPQKNIDAILTYEHPLYEIHTAIETIIPNTENIIQGSMKMEGLEFYLDRALPSIVSDHVASFCKDLIKGIPGDLVSLQNVFWAVHPGGPAVLDAVERAAKLDSHQLQASRHILSKYGNVSASSVLFVLDELRKSKSLPPSPKWGVAIAFGPGITFEGVLLKKVDCK